MRIVTKKIKLFTFSEANSGLREKIRENFDKYSFIYDCEFEERLKSLEKFADFLGCYLDYEISYVPDRGESIRLIPKEEEKTLLLLKKSRDLEDSPFTGVCYDEDLLDLVRETKKEDITLDILKVIGRYYLDRIHSEYEYVLSDEYLEDFCEANCFEFTEDGEIY